MSPALLDTIRRHCRPLPPLPTETEPVLPLLSGVEIVLFDVYGTLFVSASGDVGTSAEQQRATAFAAALEEIGGDLRIPSGRDQQAGREEAADLLLKSIRSAHQEARKRGIEYPEVDILTVWDRTLAELVAKGWLATKPDVDLRQLAVEYEVRTNPTWPMPGVRECLQSLSERGRRWGIISNAQFFTPLLFSALLGQTPEELGCDPKLQFYSYQYGWGKPGRFLYDRAGEAAEQLGAAKDRVLFIGNDMLNDIAPAQGVGFHTALYAGDRRSLRWRTGDQRVQGIEPRLVMTHLSQLTGCLA